MVRDAQVARQAGLIHREAVWFWLVIITRPESRRSCTGWLALWWPNFIFTVRSPEASPSSQMPETDAEHRQAGFDDLADGGDGEVASALRVAGAVDCGTRRPAASHTSAAGVLAGTTVSLQPVGEHAQ